MAESAAQKLGRSNSISQASENSQTAQDFINSQLQLEADAREVLPYQFDTCSRPLGPLRQKLWSCLTCNPPPTDPNETYTPAGVCYSCHVSCHGDHTLVELFAKRNFVCDCGTTRIQSDHPCSLRINEETGLKGDVRGASPEPTNHYDHNYRNRFCGCGQDYDAYEEKGTMFQCLGLGTVEDGGCGEDWWHPECIVGLPRDWYKKDGKASGDKDSSTPGQKNQDVADANDTNAAESRDQAPSETNGQGTNQENGHKADVEIEDEPPTPPGFPHEDDFEHFICYKCVEAFPWIKRYAGTDGFLQPVYHKPSSPNTTCGADDAKTDVPTTVALTSSEVVPEQDSKKRKADEEEEEEEEASTEAAKRQRHSQESEVETEESVSKPVGDASCYYNKLPPAPTGQLSLFVSATFRERLCHCRTCFPLLTPHAYLLEEEDVYEPPLSSASSAAGDDANAAARGGSVGSRSLLDKGEAALSNVDRVRAIEGVMVYNHLKDKVKDFLKPFAESGTPVGAEDIKRYFEGLRGDAEGIMAARGDAAAEGGGGGSTDGKGGDGGGEGGEGAGGGRREQSGY
ncbi:putative metaphase-anaphase transition protein [Phyllosticta citribraziliensis]|uniref:Metaphase-anaphase transition protein n=1 Tax=Phyllosticta citribraziliensis TaxID=989973 RepID=A0ABR1LCX8_9PEZI